MTTPPDAINLAALGHLTRARVRVARRESQTVYVRFNEVGYSVRAARTPAECAVLEHNGWALVLG